MVNEFYEELLKHWSVRSDVNGVVNLDSDSDEEGADLSMIFKPKMEDESQSVDPYMVATPNSSASLDLDVEMESPKEIKTGQGEESSNMGTKEEKEEKEEEEGVDTDQSQHPVEDHTIAMNDPYDDLANEPIGGSGVSEEENAQPQIGKPLEPGETKAMEISGSEIQQRIWRLRFLV